MNTSRIWLSLLGFLMTASLIGGIILTIKLRNSSPVEIVLSSPDSRISSGQVNVEGAVRNPGIYEINNPQDIFQLLVMAGLTSDADTSKLSIYVPRKGEPGSPQKIDINRAESWLLQALPGIGETRAQAIIDHRVKNGPYRSPDDLQKVTGISSSILERIRPLITTGG
jgi:competence protein ComEA